MYLQRKKYLGVCRESVDCRDTKVTVVWHKKVKMLSVLADNNPCDLLTERAANLAHRPGPRVGHEEVSNPEKIRTLKFPKA